MMPALLGGRNWGKPCSECGCEEGSSQFDSYVCPSTGRTYRRKQCRQCRYTKSQAACAIKYKYGISESDLVAMYNAQGERCAICRCEIVMWGMSASRKTVLHVDHCHKTGVVRGLLCQGCNLGIGAMCDNPDTMEAAAEYIRKSREDRE